MLGIMKFLCRIYLKKEIISKRKKVLTEMIYRVFKFVDKFSDLKSNHASQVFMMQIK